MWNEIKNEIDIENLMKKYSGFHDSCIVSINYHSGAFVDDNGGMANGELLDHSIEMILHSQWNKPIELRFTGVRKCNIVGWQDNYSCDIFDAYLAFHENLLPGNPDRVIVWSDNDLFDIAKVDNSIHEPSDTYIVANALRWRIVDK